MKLENTILSPFSLSVLAREQRISLLSLLSAARSEYHRTHNLAGPHMATLTALFRDIAEVAYSGAFVWSRYNLGQWEKFVASESASPEGGSCVFSCEPDGDYREAIHNTFKGLFVGTPTGMYPYSVSVRHGIAKLDTDALREWIGKRGIRKE